MTSKSRPWQISSRMVGLFFAAGLLVAAGISLVISKRLSRAVSGEVKARELEFVFGAIESGPLAIARLQSSAIAQQELTRLLSNPKFARRGLASAMIRGGPNLSFTFAQWQSEDPVDKSCLTSIERSFQFEDALNPFVITVTRDNCAVLDEENTIFKYSGIASLLVAIISALLLAVSIWPAASSVRRAEKVLAAGSDTELEAISFTPIRSLVRQALHNMELERDAALSRVAAQVSHDIRSPLTALNMVVTAMKNLPEDKRQIIKDAADRINSIANQLLNKGKSAELTSGPAQSTESIELIAVVESVIAEKRLQFQDRPTIEIVLDSSQGLGITANIDRLELARVLSNLITNSVEAFGEGGRVDLGVRGTAKNAQVFVSDNGKGIPADILPQIGKRKFSYGKSGGNSGSGLGLSHARETVEKFGGSLTIQSKVGAGTLVIIDLPQAKDVDES